MGNFPGKKSKDWRHMRRLRERDKNAIKKKEQTFTVKTANIDSLPNKRELVERGLFEGGGENLQRIGRE